MIIYLSIICITTLLGYFYQHVKKNQKKVVFVLMVLIPSLFSGLRGVGTDYNLYKLRFDQLINGTIKTLDGTSLRSPFYQFLRVIHSLGGNYQIAIFIISLVTIGILFYVIMDLGNKINATFAVFSFMQMYYLVSFNLFRQMLASALFVLSVHLYSKTKNKKMFIIPAILGCLVHSSVVIYVAIYLIFPFIKNKRKLRITIYAVLLGIVFSLPLLSSELVKIGSVLTHYAYYFLHFKYSGIGFGIFRYVFLVWIPILYFCTARKIKECSVDWQEYIFVAVIGSILCLTSYVSDTYMYRIGYTGVFILPLLHGVIVNNLTRNKRYLKILLAVCLIVFFYYDFIYLNIGEVYPYKFFG